MGTIEIDLFSDTVTRPSHAMRAAIAAADVGDEQLGEDPTVNALQERVAGLLGKERALLMPSGAMCNLASFMVHCDRPGDEIVLDATAHPVHFEAAGAATVARAQLSLIAGDRGVFTGEQLAAAVRPAGVHFPRTRLMSVEQTTNLGGGAVWPLAAVREVCEVAVGSDLRTHMDGARLLNAVVASGVDAGAYAAGFDSVWIDLSKGLGAPIGAVLAGSDEFIDQAWRIKKMLGGAMRQAGIIAAAGLYALDHNVERLGDDHANARVLADGLGALQGIELKVAAVETNIVIFDVAATGMNAASFIERMLTEHGIRFSPMGPTLVRAVTHLDVDRQQVEIAVAAVGELVRG